MIFLGGIFLYKKLGILLVAFLLFMSSLFIPTNDVEAAAGQQLIVINKKTNQLAYYENGKLKKIFMVGTGRQSSLTPEGKFKVVNKIKNRPYYKEKIPGGSPKNPLGVRWIGINARGTWGTTYAIHGNNNPSSIGKYVSAGCVRMYNDQVLWLFNTVAINTPVIITTSNKSLNDIAIANGYKVSGSVAVSNPTISKSLKQGDRGPAVKNLQTKLHKLGFNPNGIDGIYGKGTVNAVKKFQVSRKLKADGIAGPVTLKALGL